MGECGSEADFAAIMVWLKQHADIGVDMPRNYDMKTGMPHRLMLVTG